MRQLYTKTDKHYIATLPRYAFEGKIVVIKSVSEAERAVKSVADVTDIGYRYGDEACFQKRPITQGGFVANRERGALLLIPTERNGLPCLPFNFVV